MNGERWNTLRPDREDGIALIMAVLILAVMTIMAVAMISYTSASSRDASLKEAGQRAYALAEAGLNQALAQLASHYYDSSGNAANSSTAFATSWFTGVANSQQSPSSTAACTSTSTCMSWSLVGCSFHVPISGCSTSAGSAGITRGTVVLKGTGIVPNPTGARPLTRTVKTKLDVTQPAQLVATPEYWREIYSGAPASGDCDLSLGQGVTITAPLYVAGDLCLTSSAAISGANVHLKVLGWVWLRQSSTIGSESGSPPRVNNAQIAGGCSNSNNQQPTMSSGCTINASAGSIWDNNPSTQHSPITPTAEALPTINWSWVQDAQANSVPAPSCTNGRSLSENPFALTPTASYTCTTAIGSINYTYNPSGLSTLVVSGGVYFPGSLSIDTRNALVQYSGIAGLFVAGSITTTNNSFLCVKVAAGTCDFANATNFGSPGYWDAEKSLLLLQSQGAITGTNLRFQGGMYSATSISLTGGQGCTQGPLVTPNTITVGQQLNGSFPSFPSVPAGSLGTPPPPYNLTAPYGGTY
jgi:Tfp pilus assembly protein PilX